MLDQIPTQETQVQTIVDDRSIEDDMDHLGNTEVQGGFFSNGKAEVQAKVVVVLEKRPTRASDPPSSAS